MLLSLPPPASTILFALIGGVWVIVVAERVLPSARRDSIKATAAAIVQESLRLHVKGALAAVRRPPHLYALAALGLMALSAHSFRPDSPGTLETGFWLMVIGGLALGAALRVTDQPIHPPVAVDAPLTPPRTRWGLVGVGIFAIFLVSETNGRVLGVEMLFNMSHHLQFALFCGGVALAVWGLSGARWPLRWRIDLTRYEALILALLTGVAFILRMWGLDTTLRVLLDEMHWATGILSFWVFDDVRLLTPMTGISPYSWFYPYWQSWLVPVFGRNLTGFRAASAVIGTLTVPAVYLLGRTYFDRATAVLGAFFLTVFPPHVHFSRIAMPLIGDPLFGTLALAFIARGLKTNRRGDFALGGASLGMTQYFFEGGRLLFPLATAAWLGLGALIWRPRPRLRNLLVMALAALIVGLPFYYTLFGIRAPFAQRLPVSGMQSNVLLDEAGAFNVEIYLEHLRNALLYHVHLSEQPAIYYYGGRQPLILSYVAPFFLLGLAFLLGHPRALCTGLFVWMGLNVLGNSFLLGSYTSARYIVVLPALALTIAAGLRYTLALIWPDGRAVYQRLILVGALVAVVGVAQVTYYFGPHLEILNVEARASKDGDGEDALLRSVDFPPGTHIHIITDSSFDVGYGRDLLAFLRDRLTLHVTPPAQFTSQYLDDLPRTVDHAFYILQGDQKTLHRLYYHFPRIEARGLSPYNVPVDKQLMLYYVPRIPLRYEKVP